MAPRKLPMSLNVFMPSLISKLENEGCQINNLINQSLTRFLDLRNNACYLPNYLLNQLTEEIEKKLGVINLLFDFKDSFGFSNMGSFTTLIQEKTLLGVLEKTIKHQHVLRTNNYGHLNITGPISTFSVRIDEPPSRGKDISEAMGIIRIFDVFRIYAGKNFVPLDLGIEAKTSKHLESLLPDGRYSIKCNSKTHYIVFETALLGRNPMMDHLDIDLFNSKSSDKSTSNKVKNVLYSLKEGIFPNMIMVSDMFDVSTKTLERQLKDEGMSFRTIIETRLKELAFNLIEDPTLSINEISQKLGYTKPQNFIRAFKHWTQLTPLAYRESL